MDLIAWVDGGCFPNPGGIASYGVFISDKKGTTWEKSGIVGTGEGVSNNCAEYGALINLLEWCIDKDIDNIIINSDSALLVNQMQGKWAVSKDKLYYPYFKKAMQIVADNINKWEEKFEFVLIPREENTVADELSTKARHELESQT